MKKCPKCGKSYEKNWGVCFYCKTALVKTNPAPDAAETVYSPAVPPEDHAGHEPHSVLIFFYIGLFTLFAGLCIFSYQIYVYLKSEAWIAYSLLDLANRLKPNNPWILYPQDWLGLHRLMTHAPVSLVLIAAGAFVVKISARHDH